MDDLHIAVVDLIYNLWLHQRIIAVAYLKKKPEFWANLTLPLFDKYFGSKPKLNGCILRIVSSEIYTYAGKCASRQVFITSRQALCFLLLQ